MASALSLLEASFTAFTCCINESGGGGVGAVTLFKLQREERVEKEPPLYGIRTDAHTEHAMK